MEIFGILKETDELFNQNRKLALFCIEQNIPYPKEVLKFFKGKIGGDNIEDCVTSYVYEYLKDLEFKQPIIEGVTYGDFNTPLQNKIVFDLSIISEKFTHIIIDKNYE